VFGGLIDAVEECGDSLREIVGGEGKSGEGGLQVGIGGAGGGAVGVYFLNVEGFELAVAVEVPGAAGGVPGEFMALDQRGEGVGSFESLHDEMGGTIRRGDADDIAGGGPADEGVEPAGLGTGGGGRIKAQFVGGGVDGDDVDEHLRGEELAESAGDEELFDLGFMESEGVDGCGGGQTGCG
jgi:hypothetical protein